MASTTKALVEKPIHIVFIHLDLGIGGAEQLIINLALASVGGFEKGRVSIFTSHCDQSHCFDAVRKEPPGALSSCVHVAGSFLPANILQCGTALCSTVRMLYLSAVAKWTFPDADVFVLDVLPTPIPYLLWGRAGGVNSVLFYCHFPDKLLTRDTVNGQKRTDAAAANALQRLRSFLQASYRQILDRLEEWSMSYADLVLLNSNFTKREVMIAFPTLAKNRDTRTATKSKPNCQQDSRLQVLYPAIDLNGFIPPNFEHKRQALQSLKTNNVLHKDTPDPSSIHNTATPIVSLNRFERKKNIEILLQAYAKLNQLLQQHNAAAIYTSPLPQLIIAGGYDPNNRENKEYLQELKHLAQSLNIHKLTSFRPSITDDERASILQSALCVVYTPYREHFGIVPLEAMYAGTAVVALKSGGPMETVINNQTGILVDLDDTDQDESLDLKLAKVLLRLVQNPEKAIDMGRCGHEHVKNNFGLGHFRDKWTDIVSSEVIPRGKQRRETKGSTLITIPMLVTAIIFVLFSFYLSM